MSRATAIAVAVVVAVLALARPAAGAARCVIDHPSPPWLACFDPGTRIALSASSTGVGLELALRHAVAGDDPAVSWRLEHRALAGELAPSGAVRATAYALVLTRHASDGGLVLPTSPPRRLRLPFDLGLAVRLGDVRPGLAMDTPRVGVLGTDLFVDLARSRSFGRRLAIGVTGAWDVGLDVGARRRGGSSGSAGGGAEGPLIDEHVTAPLSRGVISMRLEDADGLTVLEARAEAGWAWSSRVGWAPGWAVEARAERVLIALNDLPLAAFVRAEATSAPPAGGVSADEGPEATIAFGLSLALSAAGR